MKITSISYQKTIPTGPYMNDRLGVEIELEPGEAAEEAFSKASKTIDKWHRENNPQLYPVNNGYVIASQTPFTPDNTQSQQAIQPPLTKEEKKQQLIKNTIQQINEASDIKVVEAFHLLAKNNPEIKEAYDKRIKELSK